MSISGCQEPMCVVFVFCALLERMGGLVSGTNISTLIKPEKNKENVKRCNIVHIEHQFLNM